MSGIGGPFALVIAAPSGAGKTSLARALVQRHGDLIFSVSATTRPRRADEESGRDYHFVDDTGFDDLVHRGELLEWATVHGRRYGTLRPEVERAFAAGQCVVLDIDVQGARQVRRALPHAVLVFVLPPSAAELARRLAGRGSEAGAQLLGRLRTARGELAAAAEFDYVVVNDEFEEAVTALESIAQAERRRVTRAPALAAIIDGLEQDIHAMLEGAGS